MDPEIQQFATLIVTFGAVCFAVAAALWAWRLTSGARGWRARLARRVTESVSQSQRMRAIFNAHPGLVLVWSEQDGAAGGDWGEPDLYGSPSAIAALLSFAEASDGPNVAGSILDGAADYEARDAKGRDATLRKALKALREEGRAFSLTITGPKGRFLHADGRPAGALAVLWLSDATVHGLDESRAAEEKEDARRRIGEDPLPILETLEKSPLPAWRMSAAGKLVWANQAYLDAVEEDTLDAALRNNVLLHPDLPALAKRAVEEDVTVEDDRKAIVAGAQRRLGFALYPVSGGAAGVAVDMSEADSAKDALARHVQAHDQTLDQMAEAVAIFEKSRRLSFHNRAFAEMFGLEEAWLNESPGHGEILDRLRERRRLPEQSDYSAWKADELRLYEDFPDESPEEIWPLPDGRTLRVARQRHPLGGLLILFEDVTQEVALSAQYKTALTVRKATLDNLKEGVAVYGSDGRLRLSNASFRSIWNIAEDALPDESHFDDFVTIAKPLHHDEAGWAAMKARITDPSPDARIGQAGELERSDGTILTWLSQPLPDGATVIAFADITAEKRERQMLQRHNEAMQEADRQKTDFVQHVSYQLRTPLTTISGYAELLEAGVAGALTDQQKEYIGSIETASQQLEKLINDILDIAAIDAGALELDLGDVRLSETLHNAVETAEGRALEAHVKLEIDLDDDPGVIRADEARLKQVVYNLLTNAIRHTPEGGEVRIGAASEDDSVRLWVSDNGQGVPADSQARVFERFSSGQGGGAGLGLALVREFVAMHGGWVEFDSQVGEGSTVTVWLHRAATPQNSAPELSLNKDAAPETARAAP